MNTLTILVLEDDPTRQSGFRNNVHRIERTGVRVKLTIVESALACINELTRAKQPFDYVLLDHDLDGKIMQTPGDENTGGEVADWVAADPARVALAKCWITHSFNPKGANYIAARIKGCSKHPGIWVKEWPEVFAAITPGVFTLPKDDSAT